MSTHSQSRMPFQLEMLETRTLLSGDLGAITSTGSIITNFDPESISSKITVASVEGGALTIDSALLPDSVKELTISGFTSVTITGVDGFQKLDLSDIGSFIGTEIAVTSELKVKEVASLTLHSISGIARLYGDDIRLDVVDARSATILSDVDHLVVSSSYHMDLWAAEANQELRFEFRLDQFKDEAELEAFLELFKDRSNILDFKVIYPEAPPRNTETEFDSSFYVVIVISISSANAGDLFLMRLHDSLKSGDPENVKTALLDYLKNVSLPESPYATSLLENDSLQTDFTGMDRFDTDDSLDSGEPGPSGADELVPPDARPQISSVESAPGVAGVLGHDFAERLAPDEIPFSPLEIPAVRLSSSANPYHDEARINEKGHDRAFDRIRSTLSSMLPHVDVQAISVSGYIIDRLGHELEPGVLPGLLVDTKTVRSRRDFGWVQI